MKRGIMILSLALLAGMMLSLSASAKVKTPQQHFGFVPGSDRNTLDYEELIGYMNYLDKVSPRLKMVRFGTSPQGRPMYVACISAKENIDNLDTLKAINKRLALDTTMSDEEKTSLIKKGKVFVLETLSMHSSEVGPSQALPAYAYQLVSSSDPEILSQLKNVVLMMVTNHNPDGMNMIIHHYRKHLGTMYEGSTMPGVYHKYIGHDNNRDFVALTQSDTQAISRLYSTEWYPQVMVEKHQMGRTGPRYFLPPNHDPIAENIEHGLWHWASVFGAGMATHMGEKGLTGVAQHWVFDNYWPGSTETCLWKNVISFLTEVSSCKIATPIFVEANELSAHGKGLAEYKKSVNMPIPWPGGWWRLSDIVNYEISNMEAILKTASLYRRDILKFRNHIARTQIKLGQNQAPYYFILPKKQHDRSELIGLVNLLLEHGINVYRLNATVFLDDHRFNPGDVVVPLAQPYRAFAKEVLEHQKFPVRHYTPNGRVIKPYDITSWSLPLHRGVKSFRIDKRSFALEKQLKPVRKPFAIREPALPANYRALGFDVNQNASYKAAFYALKNSLQVDRLTQALLLDKQTLGKGSFIIHYSSGKKSILQDIASTFNAQPVLIPTGVKLHTKTLNKFKVALVETYLHDMDAGWTRYLLDSYYIPFKVLTPGDFKKANLKDFAAVIFPDKSKDELMSGRPKRKNRYMPIDMQPKYLKGMGAKGKAKLLTYLNKGGRVIAWRQSVGLFLGELKPTVDKKDRTKNFQLPLVDLNKKAKKKGLFVPGAFVRVHYLKNHPLTLGMPEKGGVFSRGQPVFGTSIPKLDMDRRVIATYPEDDILLSGYIEGEKQLSKRTAMAWVKKGKGQLVLFSFYPQFRASTPATYKLLFNSILLDQL
jgi:hypothetical protein